LGYDHTHDIGPGTPLRILDVADNRGIAARRQHVSFTSDRGQPDFNTADTALFRVFGEVRTSRPTPPYLQHM
jgi:hypothetical protein